MSVTYPPPERQFSADEGRTILSGEIQPSGSDHNMPPYVQHVDLEQVNPKPGHFVVSTSRAVWQRFNGHGRKRVGFFQSLKAVALSSWLNIWIVFIPVAWLSHFRGWGDSKTFWFCFVAIVPLEKLFEWCGEQMALYLGSVLGDLLIVTLDNAAEVTLAIILLARCELKILQSTIIGVIVLHLLLIPGTAFLFGGSNIWEQHLNPQLVELNNNLLMVGVMSIVLPTALFSALDRSSIAPEATVIPSDALRSYFLRFSRVTAFVLLVIYICSRIFLTNPPGEGHALEHHPSAPDAIKEKERYLAEADPETNSWVCLAVIAITIGLLAVTAEFLVDAIGHVRREGTIKDEWFGLILLPLASFAADGAVVVGFFVRTNLSHLFGKPKKVPSELARGRAIDLSIQFALFWMPFFVLLAWWAKKPLHLLFDFYEVTVLLASAFLVNYITSDAKTNWVEGLIMIGFYILVSSWTWFYAGQPAQVVMLACGSVAEALTNEVTTEGTNQLAARLI